MYRFVESLYYTSEIDITLLIILELKKELSTMKHDLGENKRKISLVRGKINIM